MLEFTQKCQKFVSKVQTFAKDSKNAKGFISMQIVTKIRILSEKLLYYYRITAKS